MEQQRSMIARDNSQHTRTCTAHGASHLTSRRISRPLGLVLVVAYEGALDSPSNQ